jgi:hypothetical protein
MMSLYRKQLLIAFCPSCGSYGVPKDEKVFDPATQKSFFVCRDCFTVHQDLDLSMLRVVDGKEWSEKHPVRDHKLHTPKIGGHK